MTPTDFEFRVTIPDDARLISVIRQLAAQAAGYAQLPAATAERLASHVERATSDAISAAATRSTPLDLRFSGDARSVDVVISLEAPASTTTPGATAADDITVNWSREGARHICRIRQALPQ